VHRSVRGAAGLFALGLRIEATQICGGAPSVATRAPEPTAALAAGFP
jgi:hypothetical protein